MRILSLLIISLFLVSGCSNPREALGLKRDAPDEFKVTKNAPLEMPSSFTLPPPRPGAPRPQETAVTEQAKKALIGESQNDTRPTQAEALLLQQAGTAEANPEIRNIIDTQDTQIDESSQSVAKRLLGFGGDNEDEAVLNAKEEAERLKQIQTQKQN